MRSRISSDFARLKISVRLAAERLPPLAPQVSQVSNAVLVKREAVTLPLDHAFGLPMYVRLQSRCRANADALTVAGFLDGGRELGLATRGRSMVTVSVIAFVPVASR
jgi:hypothetical protein